MSGSGISWAICKSASRLRQITLPSPDHSDFYRPDALLAAKSTASKYIFLWFVENNYTWLHVYWIVYSILNKFYLDYNWCFCCLYACFFLHVISECLCWLYHSSAGLRSEAQESRLQMRETQRKMSELNAVSLNQVNMQTSWLFKHRYIFVCFRQHLHGKYSTRKCHGTPTNLMCIAVQLQKLAPHGTCAS